MPRQDASFFLRQCAAINGHSTNDEHGCDDLEILKEVRKRCALYVPGHDGGSTVTRVPWIVEHPGKRWQLFPEASQIAASPTPSNSFSLTSLLSPLIFIVNRLFGSGPNDNAVEAYSFGPTIFHVPFCGAVAWSLSAEAMNTPPLANETRTLNGGRPASGGVVTVSSQVPSICGATAGLACTLGTRLLSLFLSTASAHKRPMVSVAAMLRITELRLMLDLPSVVQFLALSLSHARPTGKLPQRITE